MEGLGLGLTHTVDGRDLSGDGSGWWWVKEENVKRGRLGLTLVPAFRNADSSTNSVFPLFPFTLSTDLSLYFSWW